MPCFAFREAGHRRFRVSARERSASWPVTYSSHRPVIAPHREHHCPARVDSELRFSPSVPCLVRQRRALTHSPVSMQRNDNPDSADAVFCERITRAHARTFSLASRLLPAPKRRAAYALYAFCRVADDLVDASQEQYANGEGARDVQRVRVELRAYEQGLRTALEGEPSGPVFREVARVIEHYGVPAAPLFELLAGVARDLEVTCYRDWPELEMYCQGVASSVGEMCTHVFGVSSSGSGNAAVRHARTLGVAMQLTNILRDVGEDARRGRCYLPQADLAHFGLTPDHVFNDSQLARSAKWRAFMAFQVARARSLYAAAMPGIAMLTPDAQRCASACAVGYAGILAAIEAQDYDTISTRARVSPLARMGILWDAWRYRATPVRQLGSVHG
jgi:15-cis-phytoene synthase